MMNTIRTRRLIQSSALFFLALWMMLHSSSATPPADPLVLINSNSTTSQQGVSVTISEATTNATLAYTTDGSIPTLASATIASGSTLLLPANATLNVQAFLNATNTSSLVTTSYALQGSLAAGNQHSLLLQSDGTLLASGDDSSGELGINSTQNTNTFTQVLAATGSVPLMGIVAIAAGRNTSFSVDNNGAVWAWGNNANGQLGIGGNGNVALPTQVPGISNAIAISSSQNHTVVLCNNGTLWGWGANESGEVGVGITNAWITSPQQVLSPSGNSALTGIVAIAAGNSHTLALDNQGNLWAWGNNALGQLGDSDASYTSQSLPVAVIRGASQLTGIVALSAGASNSYALATNGNVFAWGDNSSGELGLGSLLTNPLLTAVQISNLTSPVVTLNNQAAFDSTGSLWTWGDNSAGQLGVGFLGDYASLPLAVNLATSPTLSVTSLSGTNYNVQAGSFSSSLNVSVSSGGSPYTNALVTFGITSGTGELALATNSMQFSSILQVRTDSSGHATLYFQEPVGASGSSQIAAANTSGNPLFSFLSGGTAVPVMPFLEYLILGVLLLIALLRFLPASRIVSEGE